MKARWLIRWDRMIQFLIQEDELCGRELGVFATCQRRWKHKSWHAYVNGATNSTWYP